MGVVLLASSHHRRQRVLHGVFAVAATVFLFAIRQSAFAHHEGPERVVEPYVFLLSLVKQNESMDVTILIRNLHTGKPLAVPASGFMSIHDAATQELVMEHQAFTVAEGKSTVSTSFPHDGLFVIAVSLQTADQPEVVLEPQAWEVWVPGRIRAAGPAYGLSEWLGLGLLFTAAGLVGVGLLFKR